MLAWRFEFVLIIASLPEPLRELAEGFCASLLPATMTAGVKYSCRWVGLKGKAARRRPIKERAESAEVSANKTRRRGAVPSAPDRGSRRAPGGGCRSRSSCCDRRRYN